MDSNIARTTSASALPEVSVCLLSYNHRRMLREVVDSVLAQDHPDFELIISDDCSTDGSWDLIREMAGSDARIRPIRPECNLGMAANANFAAQHARHSYIALLHHDDICAPQLLRRWLEVAERHTTVAFVSNAYADHASGRIDYHRFNECTDGRQALEGYLFRQWGCPIRGTALVRRECWDSVGGMRPRFGLLADIDLWMRLAARWNIGYVREPLITVRHERPQDYPVDYVHWSWPRLRLLYEIHAANREAYFTSGTARRLIEALRFQLRLNTNELYWLLYAIAKRRWQMLASSEEVSTPYEMAPVRAVRRMLRKAGTQLLSRSIGS